MTKIALRAQCVADVSALLLATSVHAQGQRDGQAAGPLQAMGPIGLPGELTFDIVYDPTNKASNA